MACFCPLCVVRVGVVAGWWFPACRLLSPVYLQPSRQNGARTRSTGWGGVFAHVTRLTGLRRVLVRLGICFLLLITFSNQK